MTGTKQLESKLKSIVNEFLARTDVGKENANYVRSLPVLEHIIIGYISKWYFFEEVLRSLPTRILHDEGWIYVHQTHKLSPYCLGLSARDVAEFGLVSNAKNSRNSKPPKWLDKLFDQCANLICLVSQECSGAVSLNDISTVAAGYLYVIEERLKAKRYTDSEIKNIWQSFIYNVNLPFRTGNSVFTNITLEFGRPDSKLENIPVYYNGKALTDLTYKDIPSEYFDRINKGFIDAMIDGDAIGNPFTFPLITVNYDDEFPVDNPIWQYFLRHMSKFGGFYIQNYKKMPFVTHTKWHDYNPYIKPFQKGMIYSNCCRMTFDISLVEVVTGSNPFHSGSGTGGVGVFAININRILWLCKKDLDKAIKILDYLLEVGQQTLMRKRQWINEHWTDLFPYTSFYQRTTKSLYNIFSIVGGHEGLINAGFPDGVFDPEGQKHAHQLLQYILKKLEEFMHRDKCLVCLEYAPSESAAPRLAKKDLKFQSKLYNLLLDVSNDDLPGVDNNIFNEHNKIEKIVQELTGDPQLRKLLKEVLMPENGIELSETV